MKCFWKIPQNEFGCSECKHDYNYPFENNYVVGKDDKCVRCQDIEEIGNRGCIQCIYDKNFSKYKCLRCLGDTRGLFNCSKCPVPDEIFDPIKDYAYIVNDYKCLLNNNIHPEYLKNCLEAEYNNTTKKYACILCKPEFIIVIDEKSCRKPEELDLSIDCIKAKTLTTSVGLIYTCLQCKYSLENYNFYDYLGIVYIRDEKKITTSYLEYWNVKLTIHLGKMDCLKQNNELQNCLAANEDEKGIRICTKCIYNYPFKYDDTYQHNICDNKCEDFSFEKFKWCYFCDDRYYGNPGCLKESGCIYNSDNDELYCTECKKEYFKYSGHCIPCESKILGCAQCTFTKENGALCDKCSDGYNLNERTGKCDLIQIEENEPTNQIHPTNKIKPINTTNSDDEIIICKENYFKTKKNDCVYCKSRNNGGPACSLCEYEKNENGTELDNIICKYCPKNAVLSKDNKCYYCDEELGKGCNKCQFFYDQVSGIDMLECISCSNEYKLSEKKHCVHYQSYFDLIPHCSLQENKIVDISKDGNIKNDEDITQESNCLICVKDYFLNNVSECIKYSIESCAYNEINDIRTYNNCNIFCKNRNYAKIEYYMYKLNENFEKEKIKFNLNTYFINLTFIRSLLLEEVEYNDDEKRYYYYYQIVKENEERLENITKPFYECYFNGSILYLDLNCSEKKEEYLSNFYNFTFYVRLIGFFHLDILSKLYLGNPNNTYPHMENYYKEYEVYNENTLKKMNNSMIDFHSSCLNNSGNNYNTSYEFRGINSEDDFCIEKGEIFKDNYQKYIEKGKELQKYLFDLLKYNELPYNNIFFKYPT